MRLRISYRGPQSGQVCPRGASVSSAVIYEILTSREELVTRDAEHFRRVPDLNVVEY